MNELLVKNIPWNRAISQLYEPGSVFKPITMALAIEAGAVNRNTHYNDLGYFDAPGKRIINWDGRAYGDQDYGRLPAVLIEYLLELGGQPAG